MAVLRMAGLMLLAALALPGLWLLGALTFLNYRAAGRALWTVARTGAVPPLPYERLVLSPRRMARYLRLRLDTFGLYYPSYGVDIASAMKARAAAGAAPALLRPRFLMRI